MAARSRSLPILFLGILNKEITLAHTAFKGKNLFMVSSYLRSPLGKVSSFQTYRQVIIGNSSTNHS